MISTKLRTSSIQFSRNYCNGEQVQTTHKQVGLFAEFYEKTKENKQVIEEDKDFEELLRNSNFINVTCYYCN